MPDQSNQSAQDVMGFLKQHWIKLVLAIGVIVALVIGYFMTGSTDSDYTKTKPTASQSVGQNNGPAASNPTSSATAGNGSNSNNSQLPEDQDNADGTITVPQLQQATQKLANDFMAKLNSGKRGTELANALGDDVDPFMKDSIAHATDDAYPSKATSMNPQIDSGTDGVFNVEARDASNNVVYNLDVEPFYHDKDFALRIIDLNIPTSTSSSQNQHYGATLGSAASYPILTSALRKAQLQEASGFTKSFININKNAETNDQKKKRLEESWGFTPPAFLNDNGNSNSVISMYDPQYIEYLNNPFTTQGKSGKMLIGIQSGWCDQANRSTTLGTFVATVQYQWDSGSGIEKENAFSVKDTTAQNQTQEAGNV